MASKINLSKQYVYVFRYLKDSKVYLTLTALFFLFFFILGFIFPYVSSPELYEQVSEQIKEIIKELIEETKGLGGFGMWWFILSNNASIALASMFFGVFFGIIPAFLLLSNGLLIGLIVSFASIANGGDISILVNLLPHGIFEIPAIIISFALGIRLGSFVFYEHKKKALDHLFRNSVRTFLLIILPLLLFASIIETILIFLIS